MAEHRKDHPELQAVIPTTLERIKEEFWRGVPRLMGSSGANVPGRDLVAKSWDRLKHVVGDVGVIHKLQVSPTIEMDEAVARLVGSGMLTPAFSEHIMRLYDLGKKVAESSKGKPSKEDAYVYQQLVDTLVAWMKRNLSQPPPPPPVEAPRRTQVGGYFRAPGLGRPAAILAGIAGSTRGKQFPVDKELFRIGANPENDLVIQGDEFVSGSHAHLRYNQGALFVSDQKSRNGTFLNDCRLKEAALTLNPKDRIRIGDCIFEVLPAR